MSNQSVYEHKYVWLGNGGVNLLGEFKGKQDVDGNRVYEPTLDQLTGDGWEPYRETVVGTTVLIVLQRRNKPLSSATIRPLG